MGWSQYAFVEGAALAVWLGTLVRLFPRRGRRTDIEISPTVLGYLTGRRKRAIITALAMLHVRGAVRVGRPGTVKRTDGKFASADRLLAAIYAAIYQPIGPRRIAARPQVRRAVIATRKDLVAARLFVPTGNWVASRVLLVGTIPLMIAQLVTVRDAAGVSLVVIVCVFDGVLVALGRRTRTCRVRIRQLGREVGTDADSVGYVVAARGKRALREIMPRFAKDGGLLNGGTGVPYLGDGTIEANTYTWGSGA